jgi:MazG family protein
VGKDVDTCHRGFNRLISLVERLRGPNGCPWDRIQTPETIRVYLIEEAYELLEALDSGDAENVCAELGDLLFHIAFLAEIFRERGDFQIGDVIQKIVDKMLRRHPHVFGKAQASTPEQVRDVWQRVKETEVKDKDRALTSLLDSVPQELPALMRAYRLGERASRLGVGLQDAPSAVRTIQEDLARLKALSEGDDSRGAAQAFGDLLFAVVNLSRFMGVHPETALNRKISRFLKHLKAIDAALSQEGRSVKSLSSDEMAALWEAEKAEKKV